MRVEPCAQVPKLEKSIVTLNVLQQVFFVQSFPNKEDRNSQRHVQNTPQAFAGNGTLAISKIKFFKS
jgi:hypothetical protein